MTNLLICGDWHGNTQQAKTIIDIANFQRIGKIFQCGDFGMWEHWPLAHNEKPFLQSIEVYAAVKDVMIYFVDGNHDNMADTFARYNEYDDEGFLIIRDHIRYAPRGHRWVWNGTKFLALGGAYSIDKPYRLEREQATKRPGSLWFPGEQWTQQEWDEWHDGNYDVETDVIFAHDKPFASRPGWNRKDLVLCHPNQENLQTAVQWTHAKHLFHGHLHYRYTDLIVSDRSTEDGEAVEWCRVEGLDADFNAREGGPKDHWMIVKIEDLQDREVPHG